MMRSSSMRSWVVALGLLAPLCFHAQVLDPPSLRCASVNVAGDVGLNWVVPPDPNGIFAAYEIYGSSLLAGPYGLVASVPVQGQTNFLHLGAGADSGPRYYYMQTISTSLPPNVSVPSDTLATMFLTVSQSNPLGSAVLNWTPQHVPPLSTAAPDQIISMEYPQGVWTVIGQVPNTATQFEQVISVCEDSLTFRVGLANGVLCNSSSSLAGDVFQDATPPSSPQLVAVSVDTLSGLSTATWSASPEPDTDAYIIVLVQPGGNVILDTIYGQFNTTYTWAGSQAGAGAESFTVAAFDTCWTGNPPSPNTSATLPEHTTIHVTASYDRCEGNVFLDWTPYGGWDVGSYQVFAREGTGSFFLLGNFNANQTDAVHEAVLPFTTYCYVVKALKAGGGASSLSNKVCRITDYPPVPAFNYLRTATVIADDHIRVIDSVDMSAIASRYRLERSANGEPFEQIASRNGIGAGPLVVFDDLDVEADLRSYRYRVAVDDSCGTETILSNEGATIHLRTEADLEGLVHLDWNGYEDWAGAVLGYNVYCSIGGAPYFLLTTTASGDWRFTHDVSELTESNGRFCYVVEANEGGNPSGIQASSESNVSCAIQPEQFWMPNAFIAGGVNDQFFPVTAYTDVQNYAFIIYNRWGQEIWSTMDPNVAWNGQVGGSYVPQGVYAWYCAFENGAGRRFEERGTVTFLWGRE
ncbi:MAG: gliding motility-associated C-terminal domain-containing protein [Flavobacteriales bacterium]|nr:gliding motility-associated C-terminal domain-containing protein [Flavobacteriales bacterium]